jgi:Calcineurin-like phosphoesterase
MSLADWKNGLERFENKFLSLRHRSQSALDAIEAKYGTRQRQAIVDFLTRAHQQAAQAVNGAPVAPARQMPWEFSHGLALLGLLQGKSELPKTTDELKTIVMKDGTLLGCRQWELLDPRWAEALVQWLEHIDKRADFATTPAMLTMPNDVLLAIAGDWGTGPFETEAASTKIAKLMSDMKPDYSIHLGDVYYAGTGTEENNDMDDWPQGARGSFTLNSNHEMYNGGFGYFAELAKNFPLQKGTSYFALQNDHWLVIGLDSAYYSERFDLYMKGKLDAVQLNWLSALPKNKRVMILSHHEGLDALGNTQTELYAQVVGALGRDPDYWYWGHLHNGIIYKQQAGCLGRCIGHGAIPYGNASMLAGQPNVAWYEISLAGDPNYPERVLNGLAKIRLNGASISEQLIGEDGSVRWSA